MSLLKGKMFSDLESGFSAYPGLNHILESVKDLREDEYKKLNKIGVIFMGTDTLIQNEVFDILDFFRDKGFNILSLKIRKSLDQSEVENLFLPNNSVVKCGEFRWWMIQNSMNLGPLMAILVSHKEATYDNHCLSMLNVHKGYGDPFKGSPGTVRHDFSAINYNLNLLHIPDNYSDFLKDCSPFYKMQEIKDILNNLELEESKNYLNRKELFQINIHSNNTNKKSFFRSLYLLKAELLRTISYNDENIEKLYELCLDYIDLLDNVKFDRFYFLSQMREINSIEQEICNQLLSILKKKVSEASNREIIDIFSDYKRIYSYYILSSEEKFNEVDRGFFKQLEFGDFDLDDFDKHIILTSCAQWRA